MTIIVFSDSHGNIEPMNAAVRHYNPDMILHLGDHAWDADCIDHWNIPIRRVRGNCDYGSDVRDNDTMVVTGGHKIVMTHGHNYGVKKGLSSIINMGQCAKADVLLFGHTHIALCENRRGLLLMNPGTAGMGSKLTCGLIYIDGDLISGNIISI